ncbi:MAG: zinc ribbon domain-containing protein [Ignavibacteria bacterium]|nr:zinc ribbon domain-containing protein [Ignavibacteria bacterium]
MPTYDYRCENCGEEMEIFQSMKDKPATLCPKCGHNTLKKMVSMPAGLIFKGTGFYQTDYKKKSKTDKSESLIESSAEIIESKPKEKKKKGK